MILSTVYTMYKEKQVVHCLTGFSSTVTTISYSIRFGLLRLF